MTSTFWSPSHLARDSLHEGGDTQTAEQLRFYPKIVSTSNTITDLRPNDMTCNAMHTLGGRA